MTELLKCPICDKPLQPDALCASDIEMGACHAKCLEGSPVVDLDTGEERPGAKVDTFRAREIMEPDRQQRDEFEAKPGTAVHMPLLSEALINFAFNQAQEFVESGNSVREATSICANLLLDAAWKVAGAGAAADGFEPNKDKFRARVEDVLERVSFSKLDDEDASSNQPSASADPSPLQPPPTGMAVMEDGALNLAFVANALRFYANHIEGHPQRGDYFPADLRLAAEMLVAATPPPQTHVAGSEAEKIGLLEERISSLEDELYEARQAPWPEWAEEILKTLRKYGYDPVVDGEVDLGEAFKDYLEGVSQAEEYDKKRYREIIECAQAIISTSTYPNWHATARAALATTEGKANG